MHVLFVRNIISPWRTTILRLRSCAYKSKLSISWSEHCITANTHLMQPTASKRFIARIPRRRLPREDPRRHVRHARDFTEVIPVASWTTRRHSRENVGEDVGVGVGVVERELVDIPFPFLPLYPGCAPLNLWCIEPILSGHSGPLCHALSLSLSLSSLSSLSWTSMRRRRATVEACDSSDTWWMAM